MLVISLGFSYGIILQTPVKASASKTKACYGTEVKLLASGAEKYYWYSSKVNFNSADSEPTIIVKETATYKLIGFDKDDKELGRDSVVIIVNQNPYIMLYDRVISKCATSIVPINGKIFAGTDTYSVEWSPKEGLSDIFSINTKASINKNMVYHLIVKDTNDCKCEDSVIVRIQELNLKADTNNILIAKGNTAKIKLSVSGGYNYPKIDYNPKTSIYYNSISDIQLNPTVDTKYTFTATDAFGCIATDTVLIRVYEPKQLQIYPSGDYSACACDSNFEIKADSGFVRYLWNNHDTTRTIKVNKNGYYYCIAWDSLGNQTYSDDLVLTFNSPRSRIIFGTGEIKVSPGSLVSVPLVLDEIQPPNLCRLDSFSAIISFDKSIMTPVNSTPKGIIGGQRRIISISGSYNYTDKLLKVLEFEGTLGSTTRSDVVIEKFNWINCQKVDIYAVSSTVILTNLCYEGGVLRLIKETDKSIEFELYPNVIESSSRLELYSYQDTPCRIEISDLNGRNRSDLLNTEIKSGKTELELNFGKLQSGMYFVIIHTIQGTKAKIIEIL